MIKTLTGSNAFLLHDALKKIVQDFTSEHGEFGLERLSASDAALNDMLGAAQSLPFLAPKKLVIISDIASNKELNEKITILLDAVTDEVDLILVEPKFDKRSVLYKTLQKKTTVEDFSELDERGMTSWLISEAKSLGASLKLSDAQYLVSRAGLNQLKLSHELEKLALYDPTITRSTIDLMTELTPQSSVFNLLDAAFSGNIEQALRLYEEQRSLKVEPQAILAMIVWQLHIVAIVKTAGSMSPESIAKEAKLSPFVVKKSLGIARRISLQQVKKLIRSTLQLDIALKSQAIQADDALKNYLIELADQ